MRDYLNCKLLTIVSIVQCLFVSLHAWEGYELVQPLKKIRVDAGYAVGSFIGIQENYGEFGALIPLHSTQQLLVYEDVRAYYLEHSIWAFSTGVGFRHLGQNDCIWGGNIYFDYRQSLFHSGFHRVGLGFEWLGPCWDLRINAYIPTDYQQESSERVFFTYDGPFQASAINREHAFSKGFDAEVGFPIPMICSFDYYAAGGIYYFSSPTLDDYVGMALRFEVDLCKYVNLEIRSSYDRFNRWCGQAEIEIRIPLGVLIDCACENFCSEFYRSIRRNGIIFTKRCCEYTLNF